MKTKILPLTTLLFLNISLLAQKKNSPVFTAKLLEREKSTNNVRVKIFLKNISSDTLYYIDENVPDNFYIVPDNSFICSPISFRGLMVYKIPPHETIEKILLLNQEDYKLKGNLTFKIGFKYYKAANDKEKNLHKYINPKNEVILWSNELELKTT